MISKLSIVKSDMKKTLTALAVMLLSGASFAEVTISGSLIMGYKATKSTGTNAINIPGLGLNNVPAVAGRSEGVV